MRLPPRPRPSPAAAAAQTTSLLRVPRSVTLGDSSPITMLRGPPKTRVCLVPRRNHNFSLEPTHCVFWLVELEAQGKAKGITTGLRCMYPLTSCGRRLRPRSSWHQPLPHVPNLPPRPPFVQSRAVRLRAESVFACAPPRPGSGPGSRARTPAPYRRRESTEASSCRHRVSTEADSCRHRVSTEADSCRHRVSTEADSCRHRVSTEAGSCRHHASTRPARVATTRAPRPTRAATA
jgi:hypothetical protein